MTTKKTKKTDRIGALERRLAKLEERLAHLEADFDHGVPPGNPPVWPQLESPPVPDWRRLPSITCKSAESEGITEL